MNEQILYRDSDTAGNYYIVVSTGDSTGAVERIKTHNIFNNTNNLKQ